MVGLLALKGQCRQIEPEWIVIIEHSITFVHTQGISVQFRRGRIIAIDLFAQWDSCRARNINGLAGRNVLQGKWIRWALSHTHILGQTFVGWKIHFEPKFGSTPNIPSTSIIISTRHGYVYLLSL